MTRTRVLLIDPSEKGAMPLYTSMVAEGLAAADLEPIFLASRHLIPSGVMGSWRVRRWLPAARWPRPVGSPSPSPFSQAWTWMTCATVILVATLLYRPGVIHFQHPLHPRLDPWLIKILRRRAVVAWTAHDILPHDLGRDVIQRAARLYAMVDVVIVHSRPAADEVRQISGAVATVLDHPVRRLEYKPTREEARRLLSLDSSMRIVAAVGFIRAYKGYDLLADVWERLGSNAPLLLVMGELVDESEASVIARLRACSRADVRLGYASDEDVIAAMAAADLIVLPHARGSDSGSLHVARAVGTPVISSDSPQLAAVVRANQAGKVVERDPDLWARAVTGKMPDAPPPPPMPKATGDAHAKAYALASAQNGYVSGQCRDE